VAGSATGIEPVSLACKLAPRCRLSSLTWEFDFPCHSLNRRVSHFVVVSDGGQRPGLRLRRQLADCLAARADRSPRGPLVYVWSADSQPRTISLGTGLSCLADHSICSSETICVVRECPLQTVSGRPIGHATSTSALVHSRAAAWSRPVLRRCAPDLPPGGHAWADDKTSVICSSAGCCRMPGNCPIFGLVRVSLRGRHAGVKMGLGWPYDADALLGREPAG
jgi:hypothetical protein